MSLIKPFRGLCPVTGHAADVSAPPYDVVDRAEASVLAEGQPRSFLHVSRPEIDLPDEIRPYDPRVYTKGRENLDDELALRVDSGSWAIAFSLYATTIQALMDVADVDRVMPPKSTWFEPKLADGLVSHVLD